MVEEVAQSKEEMGTVKETYEEGFSGVTKNKLAQNHQYFLDLNAGPYCVEVRWLFDDPWELVPLVFTKLHEMVGENYKQKLGKRKLQIEHIFDVTLSLS